MKANRSADTKPEIALRSALHHHGLRFRKNFTVRTPNDLKVRPDIVFTKRRIAVFVDGCFWHRCPQHGTDPKQNGDFWRIKLDANVERDRRVNEGLSAAGWHLVRVWEHEPVERACDAVVDAFEQRPPAGVQFVG
jgi:DNA mismatch endonuclease (patch repair protein)